MIDTESLKVKIDKNREGAFKAQQRRHQDWTDNYTLYRDKVIINRLTQRQSVNIPLMKSTIKTVLSNTDDSPALTFEELSNNKQKEIFINEYFKKNAEDNKLEVKDIVDKKQEMIYGRSFKKLNVEDGEPYVEILDPYDVLVDRYVDPADMDTANFVIHQHIFRKLSDVLNNPNYDKQALKRLQMYYSSDEGLVQSEENTEMIEARNKRMEEMGLTDQMNPEIGETYVELQEHYVKLFDDEAGYEQIYVITTCDGNGIEILSKKPLEEIVGETKDHYWRDHYPIMSWADDVERSDFWSDGIGDIVRTPNKVVNSWYSQLVENRTLRNFGMNYYDATKEGFTPTTFSPRPFGWYPLPGKPSEVFQKVDIPDLSESLDEIEFVLTLTEKATGATNIEKGVSEKNQITLGEVKILASKSQERMLSIAKFYRIAWKEFGKKWIKLVEAQGDDLKPVKLFKKSFKGNYFGKEIKPSDWKSEVGYEVKVETSAEQEAATLSTIQKLQGVMGQMPDNQPLRKIYYNKLLDLAGLSPDEAKEVMDFEKQKETAMSSLTQQVPNGAQSVPAGSSPQSNVIHQPINQNV